MSKTKSYEWPLARFPPTSSSHLAWCYFRFCFVLLVWSYISARSLGCLVISFCKLDIIDLIFQYSVFKEQISTSKTCWVEIKGFEPLTPCLQGRCSPNWAIPPWESGSHLLSHTVSSIVPSAAWVLTIVFGMRTGVSPKRIATRKWSSLREALANCFAISASRSFLIYLFGKSTVMQPLLLPFP